MNLSLILKKSEKLAIDNSPLILTGVGVVGTVVTAVLTHKATFKATLKWQELDAQRTADEPVLTTKEQVKSAWTYYIPPVTAGVVTISAIIFANRISTKRAAALAAAFALSERAQSEYREKVVEKLGPKKEQDLQDEIAQAHIARNPHSDTTVIMAGSGDVLCCDLYTGRYFRSTMEDLKKAANEANFMVINNGYASLTDFYESLNLKPTSFSDEVGWTKDNVLNLRFSTLMTDDNQPCIAFDFQIHPIRDYDKAV